MKVVIPDMQLNIHSQSSYWTLLYYDVIFIFNQSRNIKSEHVFHLLFQLEVTGFKNYGRKQ